MNDSPDKDWRPAPEPQNELERLIKRAAGDPSLQGRMFRLLMKAELSIYVPYHPELIGDFARSTDDGLVFCRYSDAKGEFVPVFTSEAAATYEVRNLRQTGEEEPLVATLPAKVLLAFLNDGTTNVRVMAAGGGLIRLQPEAVASLVAGDFTGERLIGEGSSDPAPITLRAVPAEKVPAKLRQGIRVFCAQRRVPIGVYLFHPLDPQTGEEVGNDLRLIVWLRHPDPIFYNDFSLMIGKLVPPHLQMLCAAVTSEDQRTIAFLQNQTPLWPLTKAG